MTSVLKSLQVSNFRSIRGEISVQLDAPVIIVHGRNGVGKTSLLSAIELGLTDDVLSLRRIDPTVSQYLLHKEADSGRIKLATNISSHASEFTLTRQGATGIPVLDKQQSHFFNERCYLAQSSLSKLLELYQHQEKTSADSPLTKFVKELLQLDQYDALIDGLYATGDVRRLRELAPKYWSAREILETGGSQSLAYVSQQYELRTSIANTLAKIPSSRQVPNPQQITLEQLKALRASLSSETNGRRLAHLSQLQHELSVAVASLSGSVDTDSNSHDELQIQANLASVAFEQWMAGPGRQLDAVVDELAKWITPPATLPSASPSQKHGWASKVVEVELIRLKAEIAKDEGFSIKADGLKTGINNLEARISTLDAQIGAISQHSGTVAEALSGLLPHIHSEECPVCERDYSELSKGTLSSHVSNKIATLIENAGKLEALARDRATSLASLSNAQREITSTFPLILSSEQRNDLQMRKARAEEMQLILANLRDSTAHGSQLMVNLQKCLLDLQTKQSQFDSVAVARSTVDRISKILGLPPIAGATVEQFADATMAHLQDELTKLAAIQAETTETLILLSEVESLLTRLTTVEELAAKLQTDLERLRENKGEADRRIDLAKALIKSTKHSRTEIVRRVFNDDLNAVWRSLFVRLAPEEDFVPAFALPESDNSEVEAVLETHYRSGGKGGNPRAMLSAGNLNTAALTLFLSLHLSVSPTLPCLIIDDPVQSMDEVHISQFAALLRTLSKEKNRQIIVAVHERSLFNYLALELSPAFAGDRLITIELERALDGNTVARCNVNTFIPDNAVAA